MVVLFLFVVVVGESQWISQSSSKLPRADAEMVIGSYNDSIYLLGGSIAFESAQLVEYDISRDLFIDYGETELSIGIYGEATYFTQINNLLYIIDHPGGSISVYDMITKTMHPRDFTIPRNVQEFACLASTIRYLFVAGGYDNNKNLALLQVLDLSNNQWLNSAPPMQEPRLGHSCIVDPSTNALYAIGGYIWNKNTGHFTDTIETIDTVNIDDNTWSYIGSLSIAAAWLKSVIYNNMIYIIGGAYYESNTYLYLDTVHIIDSVTGLVSISSDLLVYRVCCSTIILVDHIIYVFGGNNGGQLDNWMMYEFVSVSTTNHPSITATIKSPTEHPTSDDSDPLGNPTSGPTKQPTIKPTHSPSTGPTNVPLTPVPTQDPSIQPTSPTTDPSNASLTSIPPSISIPTSTPTKDPTPTTSYPNTATNMPTILPSIIYNSCVPTVEQDSTKSATTVSLDTSTTKEITEYTIHQDMTTDVEDNNRNHWTESITSEYMNVILALLGVIFGASIVCVYGKWKNRKKRADSISIMLQPGAEPGADGNMHMDIVEENSLDNEGRPQKQSSIETTQYAMTQYKETNDAMIKTVEGPKHNEMVNGGEYDVDNLVIRADVVMVRHHRSKNET